MRTATRDGKIERLRRLPVLRRCTNDEVRRLAAAGELVELTAGTRMQRDGAGVDWLHLIVAGEVAGDAAGEAVIGQTAVLSGTDAGHDVWAATNVVALVLGRREFRALIDTSPGFRSAVISSVARTAASKPAARTATAGLAQVYPLRPLVSAS